MILEVENTRYFHIPCSCKGAQEMEELAEGCTSEPKCIFTTIPSQGQQDDEYQMMRLEGMSYVIKKEG